MFSLQSGYSCHIFAYTDMYSIQRVEYSCHIFAFTDMYSIQKREYLAIFSLNTYMYSIQSGIFSPFFRLYRYELYTKWNILTIFSLILICTLYKVEYSCHIFAYTDTNSIQCGIFLPYFALTDMLSIQSEIIILTIFSLKLICTLYKVEYS